MPLLLSYPLFTNKELWLLRSDVKFFFKLDLHHFTIFQAVRRRRLTYLIAEVLKRCKRCRSKRSLPVPTSLDNHSLRGSCRGDGNCRWRNRGWWWCHRQRRPVRSHDSISVFTSARHIQQSWGKSFRSWLIVCSTSRFSRTPRLVGVVWGGPMS